MPDIAVKAERMVSAEQIRKIHTLKNTLKVTEESYRWNLRYNFKKESSVQLTYNQASLLIAALEDCGITEGKWKKYENGEKYKKLGNRPKMATPSQLGLIDILWKELSCMKDDSTREKALRSWLFKHFKISDLRFVDKATVGKVICALRKAGIQAGQKKAVDKHKKRYPYSNIGENY